MSPQAGRPGAGEPRRQFPGVHAHPQADSGELEIGHHVSTVAHLGNLAFRTSGRVEWDAVSGRVVGNEAAQKLVSRQYREPWTLAHLND